MEHLSKVACCFSAAVMFFGGAWAAQPVYHTVGRMVFGGYDRSRPMEGTLLTAEPQLVFPGADLANVINRANVVFGALVGGSVGEQCGYEAGGYLPFQIPASGTPEKAVLSFMVYDSNIAGMKVACVEFLQWDEGVAAHWIASRYKNNVGDYKFKYPYVDYGGKDSSWRFVEGAALGGEESYGAMATSPTAPGANLAGLAFSRFVTGERQLTFANPAGEETLTIDAIKDYDFVARTGGAYVTVRSGEAKCRERYVNDDNLILVLTFQDQDYVKGLVLELTDGDGGVWVRALKAFYKSKGKLDSRYWDNATTNLTAGTSGGTVATAIGFTGAEKDGLPAGGYGLYDLTATAPKQTRDLVLDRSKTWSELVSGVDIGSREVVLVVSVTGEAPTLTFDTAVDRADVRFVRDASAEPTSVTFAKVGTAAVSVDVLSVGGGLSLCQTPGLISWPTLELAAANAVVRFAGDGEVSSTITGFGGVVVESGTIGFSSRLSSYEGTTVVRSGATVKALASCYSTSIRTGPFGLSSLENVLKLEAGAKLDIAGHGELNYLYDLAEDDQVVNSGAEVSENLSSAVGFILRSDVTFDMPFYSMKAYDISRLRFRLDLNGHTATKTGDYTLHLWPLQDSLRLVGAGMLHIMEGKVNVDGCNVVKEGTPCVVMDEGTELNCTRSFAAHSFTNNGAITAYSAGSTTNTFDVTEGLCGSGTFTKTGNSVLRVTVGTGSKVLYENKVGLLTLGGVGKNNFEYALNEPGEPRANHCVKVNAGTTFDVLGYADSLLHVVLAGTGTAGRGALVNTGKSIGFGSAQVVQLTLDADATIGGVNGFGLVGKGYNPTRIELGSHTLTLDFADESTNKMYHICKTTVTGTGTIRVADAALTLNGKSDGVSTSEALEARVEIAQGASLDLSAYSKNRLRVKDFRCDGTCTGSGMLEVLGTLEVGSALRNVTLASGAKVKPAADAAPLVATQLTVGDSVVFDLANVVLDPKDQTAHPLLSAPVSGTTTYSAVNVPKGCRFLVRNGVPSVAVTAGIVVIVR